MILAKKAFACIGAVGVFAIAAPAMAETEQAQAHAERRMKAMDEDKDGFVSLEEYTEFRRGWTSKRDDADKLMKPKLVKREFGKLDGDGDGSASFDEVLAHTKKMPRHR